MNDAVASPGPLPGGPTQTDVSARPDTAGRAIKHFFPGFDPSVIFDVGANTGRSAAAFSRTFPSADIYAFEPVSSLYATLEADSAACPRVHAFNLALGRRSGRVYVTRRAGSASNRIVDAPNFVERHKTECVPITSGDEFASEHGVERIGFLKIDAEGHDLDVLVGFQEMLFAGRVDILETEVGMNRDNRWHVPFEAVKAYLEPIGYRLFHLYDLTMDTPFSGRTVLRRVNAMFAAHAFLEANRKEPRRKKAR